MQPKYWLLFLLLPLLSSCELAFLGGEPDTDPLSIFNEAWTFADREYAFFDYKGIDWQAQYDQYVDQIQPNMRSDELFDVLADMLYELRDGHVNLTSSFDRSRNWRWYLDYPQNYDFSLLERSYFQEEQQYNGGFIVYDFGDVGYLSYRSFSYSVGESQLTYLLNLFRDHKGLIIDIRNNGGGSTGNARKIAERFTESSVLVARERYRNGPAHDDFSPWEDITLDPYRPDEIISGAIYRWNKPVVVLTNRSSYSASTYFVQYMRELPKVTIMGDWTGGGGGAPSYTELANGWTLRVSNTQLEGPGGFNVEDGIPPDVQVDMDEADRDEGKDTILEQALELIRM